MSKSIKIKSLDKMDPEQALLYEILPVGNHHKDNVQRNQLVDLLGMSDPHARSFLKTLVPFAPVVADRQGGYYIADSITEIDAYVESLTSMISGVQETIKYLKKHRMVMAKNNEF